MSVSTKQAVSDTGMKKPPAGRDVRQEEHLRAIAVWQRIGGLLGLIGSGLMLVMGVASGAGAGAVILPLFLGAVAAAALAVGQGLWDYRAWGRWAVTALQGLPLLGGAFALLSGSGVLGPLVQIGWAAAIVAALLSERTSAICTDGYRARVERSPQVTIAWWTSPFFFVPAALLVLGLIAALVMFGGLALMMR